MEECIDVLQYLYFSINLLDEKGGEWEDVKGEARNIVRELEKYCRGGVIDSNKVSEMSKVFYDYVKEGRIASAMDAIMDFKKVIEKGARPYLISKIFLLARLLLSISLLVISLILMLSPISIYQWLINLAVLSLSMASLILSLYSYAVPLILIASAIETANVTVSKSYILLLGLGIIVASATINITLGRLFRKAVKSLYNPSSSPTP
ncbi:MAG: hypothetical protein F7B61_04455 [Caldisphaeraceae archaeon]|nr:hypothetical protein [Caldisphaeraceae archaeon]